jgi:gamma-glutamyltranspeptidase/glutathione hydrolase
MQTHFEPHFDSHRSPVLGTRGSVASSQPLATAAGLGVLARGGNAADAAVATAAALNVTEPMSTGIGGDCFALYYDAATREVTALNGSGRAPQALDLARIRADGFAKGLPVHHAHTVTVPGACAGWCDFNERHGSLPMRDVLSPAIALAEEGFPVAPMTAIIWRSGIPSQLPASPGGRHLMLKDRAPNPGEIFRNPALGDTFRRVADEGAAGFYRGEIARAIVRVLRDRGGVMNDDDLASHVSSWEAPISTVYRDLRVWECAPNGQGLAALLALNLLRGFDLQQQDPMGPDRFHLMIEAMRLGFADARWHVADPSFAEAPLAALLSDEYADARRALIRQDRADTSPARGEPIASSDTVYLCTADASGNACSFINSNYMGFGSGLVPDGFGFALQNRGHNFSLDPDHPNVIAPGKRPYHTIIPGLLTRESDGSLYGPFGVMGGFMQPQGHMQVVVAMADDDADPQAALDRSRFQIEEPDGRGAVALETSVPEATFDALAERGHNVKRANGWARVAFGRGQIIRREADGVLVAGSDPRADGCAMTL